MSETSNSKYFLKAQRKIIRKKITQKKYVNTNMMPKNMEHYEKTNWKNKA